jgi:hypothetical protein
MNKVTLSVCLAFAFFVASADAQMAPRQQSPNSSPTMSQPGQYPSQGTSQTSPDQSTTTQNQANAEHTIKGCVQSEGGSYVLQTKKGKDIALTGEDVSAHVGHEVSLKGTWGEHAMSSTEAGSTSNAAAKKAFNVSSVKMISETCKAKGSMGSSSSPSETKPSGTGTSTQPPQ